MITQIGILSGSILDLLKEKRGPMSIKEICLHLDEAVDLTNMAIGWLVRQRFVDIVTQGNENYLSLPLDETVHPAITTAGCSSSM